MLIPDKTIKGLKTRKALISAIRNRAEEEVTTKSSVAALTTLVNLNKILIEALLTPTLEGDRAKLTDKEPASGKVEGKKDENKATGPDMGKLKDDYEKLKLGAFRRDFKVNGVISDPWSKNNLSFCGLIRQINAGISKGYAEKEIVEGVIRAAEQGSSLRDYLDPIGVDVLKLPRLRRMLRIYILKKKVPLICFMSLPI